MAIMLSVPRSLALALPAVVVAALIQAPSSTAADVVARDSLELNPIGPVLAGKRVVWTAHRPESERVSVRISDRGSRPRTILRAHGVELLSASASHVGVRSLRGATHEEFRTSAFAGPLAGAVGPLESCAGGKGFGIAIDGHRAAVARCNGSIALYDLKSGGPPQILEGVRVKATSFKEYWMTGAPGAGGRLRLAYPFLAVEGPATQEVSTDLGERLDVYDIRKRRIVGSARLSGGYPIPDFDVASDGALALSGEHEDGQSDCARGECPLFDIFHVPLGGAVPNPAFEPGVVALATDPRIRIDGPHIVLLREIGDDLPALTAWNRRSSKFSLVARFGTRRPILAVRDFDARGGRAAYAVRECDGAIAFITTPIAAGNPPRKPRVSCPARLASSTLRIVGHSAKIGLRCRRGCRGSLTLRRKGRRLAAAPIRLPAGTRTRGVRLRLSRRGRATLQAGTRATIRLATRDRTGARRVIARRLAVAP